METFGLTAAEASACGTPVVAFRTGGLPDAVAHGETGILVDEVGDPAALAESITALLRDPAGREQMGRHGRSRALAQLDIGITVARFKELYERLLARPEGR
jgi:glycosyltransferase involved in cell wall biosynthesis